MNRVEPPGGPGSRSLETRAQDALDTFVQLHEFLAPPQKKGLAEAGRPRGRWAQYQDGSNGSPLRDGIAKSVVPRADDQ